MKIHRLENLRQMQRQYHRSNPWGLSQGGLYIPHSYKDTKPDELSWWDDVGFVLNKRRIIVWWQHPRYVYAKAIEELAWKEAGDGPKDNWLTEGATKNYKKVGISRKKIVSYTSRQPSIEQRQHYELLRDIGKRLASEGIDHDVPISWKLERLEWAMGVSIIAPFEVRSQFELASLADVARKLVLGKTTLQSEFPGYHFGRAEWISEQTANISEFIYSHQCNISVNT